MFHNLVGKCLCVTVPSDYNMSDKDDRAKMRAAHFIAVSLASVSATTSPLFQSLSVFQIHCSNQEPNSPSNGQRQRPSTTVLSPLSRMSGPLVFY